MTPLLILTHGEFGPALLKSAESMFGALDGVLALALGPDETREAFAARLDQARASLDGSALVFVDVACGTPWNVALAQGCAFTDGEVMAGVSLPLLLEAVSLRATLGPRDLAAELARLVPRCIMRASELLPGQGGCP